MKSFDNAVISGSNIHGSLITLDLANGIKLFYFCARLNKPLNHFALLDTFTDISKQKGLILRASAD